MWAVVGVLALSRKWNNKLSPFVTARQSPSKEIEKDEETDNQILDGNKNSIEVRT